MQRLVRTENCVYTVLCLPTSIHVSIRFFHSPCIMSTHFQVLCLPTSNLCLPTSIHVSIRFFHSPCIMSTHFQSMPTHFHSPSLDAWDWGCIIACYAFLNCVCLLPVRLSVFDCHRCNDHAPHVSTFISYVVLPFYVFSFCLYMNKS